MKSYEVMDSLKEFISDNDIVISSNGNISREAFHLLPQPQIYLRGSMGLPVSVGLGVALANPDKRIIVITGDGNFLMGLGSAVTAAYYKPKNLRILILDNSSYFTTGGQQTVSSTINFSLFLESLKVDYCKSKEAKIATIKDDFAAFFHSDCCSFLHLQIEKGKKQLENIPWHPKEITKRIISKIKNTSK